MCQGTKDYIIFNYRICDKNGNKWKQMETQKNPNYYFRFWDKS